jgi:hypothetical protein
MKYLFGVHDVFYMENDKVEHHLSGFIETHPTLVISAESSNFLYIVDANNSAVKTSGYTKEELKKLTIDTFW